MQEIKVWIKKYLEFGLGTVFGAIVATITTYVMFQIAGGDIDQAKKNLEKINLCVFYP